jgi:hypothetical protein
MTKRLILLMVLLAAAANAQTFQGLAPTSIPQGATTYVTLWGTYMGPGSCGANAPSGTGITLQYYASSGCVTGGNQTTLYYNFIVASNATLGTRTITLTGQTTHVTNSLTFTVVPAMPTLTGLSPSTGRQGATVPVTLTGTNLTGGTISTLTGITFSSVVSTATTITANFIISPSAPVGTQMLTATTAGGTTVNSFGFAVTLAANTRRVILVN